MADLIDLLAAHAVVDMTLDGGGVQCKCQPQPMDGTCMWSPEDQAAHVALVVEQHTNGRIAENTGLRRELADEQQRQSDASAELRVLRAMVARVEKLAAEYARDDQEHLNTFGQHHPVAGIAHDHLRAALEGEQQ